MKSYNFDGHKLVYHPGRVHEFLTQGDCFPLYLEISPVGSCNHRCLFCAYDFIGYPNRKLETVRTLKLLDELASTGLTSILFAGEGEPLLHPDLPRFVQHAKCNGIDVGLFTNGQLLTGKIAEQIIPFLTFLRFSFNAGTPEAYARVHRVKPDVFEKVLSALQQSVLIKQKLGANTTIGAQLVVILENIDSLPEAAALLKRAGADYLAIKPFVQQDERQGYTMSAPLDLQKLECSLSAAEIQSCDTFKVMARRTSFEQYGQRRYRHCFGTSFISAINSAGDVASCLPYWDNPGFVYGNINEQSFQEIWQGERRKAVKSLLEERLKVQDCPPNCRPNAINDFLYELKFPTMEHINFI